MRCFLRGFNSCSRGWGDCLAFRHLFFPVHYKDSSIICDSFPPSSQASTDEPSIRLNTAFCASRCLLLFPASSSQALLSDLDRKCIIVKEVFKKKKKRKEHTTVGGNVWLKWNEGDWKWHLKWALVFFCWRSDVCVRELFTFRVELFFFPLCWTEWKDATEKLTEEALHHWLFASDSHWRHLCTERQRLNPASKLVFVLLGSRPHYISSECALQPFWIAVM